MGNKYIQRADYDLAYSTIQLDFQYAESENNGFDICPDAAEVIGVIEIADVLYLLIRFKDLTEAELILAEEAYKKIPTKVTEFSYEVFALNTDDVIILNYKKRLNELINHSVDAPNK